MANWKIQDIAPPKKLKEKEEKVSVKEEPIERVVRNKKGLSGWIFKGVLPLLILFGLSFGAVHFYFATAKISLWPQTRAIKLLEPIIATVGTQELNEEDQTILAETLGVEKKATRLFPASSNTIKEDRASGTIRVFNAYSTSPQSLIAQTRFVSEEGKLFRTPIRVTIPGANEEGGKLVPGFLDINVVAAEAGEDYNIDPSNFSLPGLSGSALFTAIYAESTQSIIGGSEREVSVVSKEDIEQAKESLTEELTQKVTEELLGQVPEDMVATKDSVVIEVKEAESLVAAGAELDQFNVSVSLEATLFMLSKADLDNLVNTFLETELNEGERIAQDKTITNFQQIAVNIDKDIVTLDFGIEAIAFEYIDPTELKIKLRGKSKEEAQDILVSYNAFKQADISLWPFWISSLPQSVEKLEINSFID